MMKYYVRNSEINEVKEIICYDREADSKWFTEVAEPKEEVVAAINSNVNDFSPYVVESGKVVLNAEKNAKIEAIKQFKTELAEMEEVDVSDLLIEIAEIVGKIPGNKLKLLEKFKSKKDKKKQIDLLVEELKGGKKDD